VDTVLAEPEPSQPSRSLAHRLVRIGVWIGGVALVIFVLDLLGVPADDWIRDLFDKLGEIPAWAVLGGVVLGSAQTTFAALAWFGILRAALPRAQVSFRLVLACYAAAVAMNGFLPANIGTWVMLIMFSTLLAGATFTATIRSGCCSTSSARSRTTTTTWPSRRRCSPPSPRAR